MAPLVHPNYSAIGSNRQCHVYMYEAMMIKAPCIQVEPKHIQGNSLIKHVNVRMRLTYTGYTRASIMNRTQLEAGAVVY